MAETPRRAARADAGRPRLTRRDALALEWIAQQYGAPHDVVARLLGTTEQRAYAVIGRWVRLGQVETTNVDDGPRWVWLPPVAAAQWLGWPTGPWRPRVSDAAYHRAVSEVRLALTGRTVEGWTSYRVLRHDLGEDADPSCDGIVELSAGRPLRVRVWTDAEDATAGQVAKNLATLAPSPTMPVLYVVTDDTAEAITQALTENEDAAPAGAVGRVHLAELAGAEPGTGWTLTPWLAELADDTARTNR